MNYRTLTFPALAALLFAALVVPPAAAQEKSQQEQDPQRPEVILDTALVTVPVTVTDGWGRFVTGIQKNDFKVAEDGVPQEIAEFSDLKTPFSVALLLDLSHSTRQKLPVIKKAALEFVKQLQPRDRVLVVAFSDGVEYLGDFSNDQRELNQRIETVKSGYGTSLYDAVQRTITEKLLPLAGRKALVVLTDGVDTTSKRATFESTLQLISLSGIVCYAVQYETRNDGGRILRPSDLPRLGYPSLPGNNFLPRSFAPPPQFGQHFQQEGIINIPRSDERLIRTKRDRDLVAAEYLRAMAFQSGARYLRAESIEMTALAFGLIADELRHQYTLTYYSKNEENDGGFRSITVNLKRTDLQVRARQGYFAPKRERPGDAPEAARQPGDRKP
jgi:Ca-activated chloride channel homolog